MELTMAKLRTLERMLIGATLATIALLAWAYMAMPISVAGEWNLHLLGLNAIMWTVMMVAMMLPGAAPMIMTYTRVYQRRNTVRRAVAPTGLFMLGYLAVWTIFGLVAALAQWTLHQTALLTSAMGHVEPLFGGALLVLAGLFQFSRLKQACLSRCQSPLTFLMTEWRDGAFGAFAMGARHGAFCTGCCWALMLLMFVGGVMSLVWMGGLALYFLAEKVAPWPRAFSQVTGSFLVAGGLLVGATY
jgi:predicted metal-binding membrane protein